MKGRFWRKTLAACLALLLVSGNVPINPVADLFGGAAITASAEEAVSLQQDGSEWYVNMPKTGTSTLTLNDASIKTFKVYDNSGKDGYYYVDDNGYLLLTVPDGYNIKVSGYVKVFGWSSPLDYLDIYDGSSTDSQKLGQFWNSQSGNTTIHNSVNVTSSSNQILLHFVTNNSGYINDQGGVYLTIDLVTSLPLNGSADNYADISAAAIAGGLYNATISNRTIYADGEWNTLTLPFSLTAEQIAASPLADFTIKELSSSTSDLEGEGTITLNFADATTIEAGKPYIVKWHPANVDLLIRSKADWDAFADRVNNGETFEGKLVRLADDFDNSADPVTEMVGTYKDSTYYPFKGTFDGNGRTLTVNLDKKVNLDKTTNYTSPFYCINGATIKNLRVAGSITSEGMYIAGLVGRANDGTASIQNCEVSATLTTKWNTTSTTSNANNSGLVSVVNGGSLTISNCLFSGKMLKDASVTSEQKCNAGIVGYAYQGTTTVTNCLFAPTEITMSTTKSQAIAYKSSKAGLTITNCYYNSEGSKFGNSNGGQPASTSVSTLVSALGTSNWQEVNGSVVPKMTITTTSHDDIADLKFDYVEIDAKAPVYSDDNVTFTGSYSAAENTDSLLFNKHNNNKAFEAAFRVKNIKGNGFAFRDWAAVDSESALQNNTLVLKAGKKEQVHNITISDEINGGTVSADETIAAAGDTVTLTVTPDTGRNVKSISVNNGAVDVTDNGNGTYSFEMPDGDVTVGAEFEKQKFTVTWKNGDAVLETDENVEYGTTPEYNGETPTKDADVQYTYTFSDWSPAVDAVTGNVTYTAQFSKTVNKYTVTWKNGDTILETDEDVEYGATPEYNGETPTKPMDDKYTYKFSEWSPAISSVEGDIVYTALFIVAVRPKCGDRAYWSFDESTGKLTISGTGAMYDYSYNTLPWYNYKSNITSVEIENGITSIGKYAFDRCTGLTSIKIPDSVESIDNYAFQRCRSLASIEIPDSVTSIGIGAFLNCTSLTSVEIPKNVTSIDNYAFQGCTSLTSIVIPAKVTNIGADAFYNCTNITDVYCYADPANLAWNENGCDDFIETPKHTTVCHVPKKDLETYEENFDSESENPVNVRFVGDVDMGLGEHLYGHSITLDGSIGVNFYVELTDELLASETAEMVFTVPNGSETDTQTLLVKDVIADDNNKVVIGSKTYYKFKCSISAKDMASEITAQLIDGEKSGTEYTYSVKDYADYLLAHTEVEQYEKAAPLVKAMLNYGAASQTYFGIEGTAANASLTDADKALGEVSDLDTFELDNNVALPEGVTFEGATLSLKSETTLSLYFKGLADGTKFTCDGKTVETAKNGEYVVARIRGIKASELENNFTVTFEDDSETYSVTYNVMTYCYNVLNDDSNDAALEKVCCALYRYAEEAREYFGGNN